MNRIAPIVGGGIAVVLILGVLAFSSGVLFIVPETHSAVVTRFGEVRRVILTGFYQAPDAAAKNIPDHVLETGQIEFMRERYEEKRPEVMLSMGAGLYVKLPWLIEEVHFFDTRLLDWDGKRTEVATKDLRTLVVDSASRWRILDPVQFFESIGSEERFAQGRLDEVIVREIEDMVTVTLLIETVRNQNLTLEEEVQELLEGEETEGVEKEVLDVEELRYGRMHMIEQIQQKVATALRDRFGIRLIDIMITELNYTDEVQKRVFDRMTAERKRIASRHRAQGEEKKQQILGEVEEQKRKILGNARGREIEIVGQAHDRDREFYQFWRSLQVYDKGFDDKTVFILADDNSLLRFMTSPEP